MRWGEMTTALLIYRLSVFGLVCVVVVIDGTENVALRRPARSGRYAAQLDVASDNPRALRLYTRAGMTPRHRVHVFEKPPL
jgi:hypothetical protein